MSQSNTSNKKLNVLILSLLLTASVGGNIFQFFHTRQVIVEREKTKFVVDSLTIRKNRLESEYQASLAQLDQFQGENEQLDSLLQEAYSKIEDQKKRISALIDQNQDYQVLQQRFDELKQTTQFYLDEIARLKEENRLLKNENTQLTVELNQTKDHNQNLQGQVDKGSKLIVGVVSMKGLIVKNSGKTKPTDKARKTERISINFSIDENPIATKGKHTIYIRIINPEGFVLADAGQGVKKFRTSSGQDLPYSKSTTVDFDGSKASKYVTWDQDVFGSGVYTVEIYIDNYYSGGGKLTLY